MSFVDLPSELIYAILKFRDGDMQVAMLHALCLTCRFLRAHANALLYAKIYIPGPNCLFRFARTMLHNRRLAKFVISYHGLFFPPDAVAFKHLADWVQHIVNLKRLHLVIWHDASEIPFPKCPFRLESLEVSGYSLPPDSRFFKDQNDLLFLSSSIHRHAKWTQPSQRACVNLKVLRGSIHTAKAFLPGRRVIRFEWEYLLDEPLKVTDTFLRKISDPLGRLRSLSYRRCLSMGPFHPVYPLHIPYFHSLRFLEVERLHHEDCASIPSLSQLRILLILDPDETSMRSVLNEPYPIFDLFSKCLHLERIDFGWKRQGFDGTCYRWVRGETEPILIPLHVAERGRIEYLDEEDGNSLEVTSLSIELQDDLTRSNSLTSLSWIGSSPKNL